MAKREGSEQEMRSATVGALFARWLEVLPSAHRVNPPENEAYAEQLEEAMTGLIAQNEAEDES